MEMRAMKRIFGWDQLKLERRMIEVFGDGSLRADASLFDQMINTNLIELGMRQSVPDFLQRVRDIGTVVAFLDRGPDNLWCAMRYLDSQYHELIVAHELNADELHPLLACTHCDLYILSRSGELMAIATHEDPEEGGLRQIWAIQRQ